MHGSQGFPNGVDLCGGKIWAKWPKTAWKLQNQHFGGKTVRGQAMFRVVGESPTRGNPDCLACKYSKTPSDFFSSAMLMFTVAQM